MKKILAINGGKKIIKNNYPHFVWPIINNKIERAVVAQLHESISIYDSSGIFERFESDFGKYHDRKYTLLCSSGTLAIHSMFVAAGFQQGDEVICPAYTFFATVSPLLFTGAKPVLCDCDQNGNIDPEEIKRKITSSTKGIIITHMWGIPCQLDKIIQICRKNKLLLLEDCSHAHGARYKGKVVGSFGDMAAWSIQGPKLITGGEGGIFATNNKDLFYKALLLGHYNKRCKQQIPKKHPLYKYAVTGMGLKYRAHPLAIAIAYEILQSMDKDAEIRNKIARLIISRLKKFPCIEMLPAFFDKDCQPSWYALLFRYKSKALDDISSSSFVDALQAEGLREVDIPKTTAPLNLLPLFNNPAELFPLYKQDPFSYKKGDFPMSEKFYNEIIKIPVWSTQSSIKIVNKYIKGFEKVLNNSKELAA